MDITINSKEATTITAVVVEVVIIITVKTTIRVATTTTTVEVVAVEEMISSGIQNEEHDGVKATILAVSVLSKIPSSKKFILKKSKLSLIKSILVKWFLLN